MLFYNEGRVGRYVSETTLGKSWYLCHKLFDEVLAFIILFYIFDPPFSYWEQASTGLPSLQKPAGISEVSSSTLTFDQLATKLGVLITTLTCWKDWQNLQKCYPYDYSFIRRIEIKTRQMERSVNEVWKWSKLEASALLRVSTSQDISVWQSVEYCQIRKLTSVFTGVNSHTAHVP